MATNTCDSCKDSSCGARKKNPGESENDFNERQKLFSRMCRIEHKIFVLSGKGGVGKSTVAVNIAVALAMEKKRVGILDVDLHGPSIPALLGIVDGRIVGDGETMHPVRMDFGEGLLEVVSMGFLLSGHEDAVIWRGPRKYGVIRQFLKDVEWGDLDYLIIDSPPGTGDEPLAVAQLIEKADGAVVVTTPQEIAVQDVRRCIAFCRNLEIPVLGVVENMSGFTCPKCNEHIWIFKAEGGRKMAAEMAVPYLGAVPIEPEVVVSGDSGTPIVKAKPDSTTARAFSEIVKMLIESRDTRAEKLYGDMER